MFVLSKKTKWRSRSADAPRCAHFPTAICCVNQEGVISARTEARQRVGSATQNAWTKQTWKEQKSCTDFLTWPHALFLKKIKFIFVFIYILRANYIPRAKDNIHS